MPTRGKTRRHIGPQLYSICNSLQQDLQFFFKQAL